ncbi:thermonuclease family protein [Parvularcula oceani]|uniref:thermonuclease family protein n=1 Tax=Parvularcula oceani TaxID=1247963 RepID=UPI0004E0C958|nr:thermonuclease family protein [Parvularcula oceani]
MPKLPLLTILLAALAAVSFGLIGLGRSPDPAVPPDEGIRIVDGDTVAWHGRLHDLYGIDAPELGQRCLSGTHLYPCGLDAALALDKRIKLDPLHCEAAPERRSELVCHVGGSSLAELQIHDGYAYPDPGAPYAFRQAAQTAKAAHLGVWRGEHVAPARWLEGERLPAENASPQACPVIGVSEEGARLYFVPTDADYRQVAALPGITRFCSDEEARSAGWRYAPGS